MNDLEFQTRLNAIPHLDLGLQFDGDGMAREAQAIDSFSPYKTLYQSDSLQRKELDEFLGRTWQGRTLLNYNRDSFDGIREYTKEELELKKAGHLQLMLTDLGERCPLMVDAIRSVGGDKYRGRLMKITKGGHLGWHNHIQKYSQVQGIITLHVPVLTPPNFWYSVTPEANIVFDEKNRKVPRDRSKIVSQNYKAGRAYIFNSYHYHNVWNAGDFDRLSLMLFVNAYDLKMRPIIERAIEAYTGPLIQ